MISNSSLSQLNKLKIMDALYIRNPELVAQYLQEHYFGKYRLAIYSSGNHTKEVIESLDNIPDDLIIVDEFNTEETYIRHTLPHYTIQHEELVNHTFDYLVLLGDWKETSVNQLARDIGIEIDKILLIYKEPPLVELLNEYFVNVNSIKLTNDKPNIFLILNNDRKDIITNASDVLSDDFNLYKFYIEQPSFGSPENKNFLSVKYIRDYLVGMNKIIKDSRPDIVIYWLSTPYETWKAWFIKHHLPAGIKFVIATTDIIFNNVFEISDNELASSMNMELDFYNVGKDCEMDIIKESDGIITNFGGSYWNDVVSKYNGNPFFSYYFHKPEQFCNKIAKTREISLCFAGALGFDGDENKNVIESYMTLDRAFEDMLQQGLQLYIYNAHMFGHHVNDTYKKLGNNYKNFNWKPFVISEKLPEELSQYHFGLAICNITERSSRTHKTLLESIFQARVISYLSAGIPVVVNKEYTILSNFIESKQVGISIASNDFSDLKSIIMDTNYDTLKKNVLSFQQEYKNEYHAKNISKYLMSLIKD